MDTDAGASTTPPSGPLGTPLAEATAALMQPESLRDERLLWLVDAAKVQLQLLTEVYRTPSLHDPSLVRPSIDRYLGLWLPLRWKLQSESSPLQAAPLDVAWVWHCHMLDPVGYQEYCTSRFGGLVEHQPRRPTPQQSEECARRWGAEYPDHPFDGVGAAPPVHGTDPAVVAHLLETIPRQAAFAYQVSPPYYMHDAFLAAALLRYARFLVLKQRSAKAVLAPTYDIDLLWHAHQLCPSRYAADTRTLLGRVWAHDDSLQDRSAGSTLNAAHQRTRNLWRGLYGGEFNVAGGMFRGEPPPRLPPELCAPGALEGLFQPAQARRARHRVTRVSIQHPDFKPKGKWYRKDGLLVVASAHPTADLSPRQLKLKESQPGTVAAACEWELVATEEDPSTQQLCLALWRKKRTAVVCTSKTNLGEAPVPLSAALSSAAPAKELSLAWPGLPGTSLGLAIASDPLPPAFVFSLQARALQPIDVHAPSPFDALLDGADSGPAAVPPLPLLVRMPGGQVAVATELRSQGTVHRVAPVQGPPLWCTVVHSRDTGCGAQVAHVQLLSPSGQVLSQARTCGPMDWIPETAAHKRRPRAVLVSFDGHDWGRIHGEWTGLAIGVPGVKGTPDAKGTPGRKGSEGQLLARLQPLSPAAAALLGPPKAGRKFQQPPRRPDTWELVGAAGEPLVSVDLSSGRVAISAAVPSQAVAPLLQTAFALPLLRSICRTAAMEAASAALPAAQRERVKANAQSKKKADPSDGVPFVNAFGGMDLYWSTGAVYWMGGGDLGGGGAGCGGCGGWV